MSEILTGLLVVITAFYAWVTFRILKGNERIVKIARDQMESLSRPYINIRSFTVPKNTVLFLKVENIGKTSAYNVRLQLDKDFYQFAKFNEKDNLRNLTAFSNEIKCFPPGADLTFYLAIGPQLFGKEADPNIVPVVFSITATYKFAEKTVTEKFIIDLRMHLGSAMAPDAIVTGLHEIKEALEKLPGGLGEKLKPD